MRAEASNSLIALDERECVVIVPEAFRGLRRDDITAGFRRIATKISTRAKTALTQNSTAGACDSFRSAG